MLKEAVARIQEMEQCFDALCEATERDPAEIKENELLHGMLLKLEAYYEGGQWLRDYELDEAGLLPLDLKRGVLSQDGVYELLQRINHPEA